MLKKERDYLILMADVLGSRTKNQRELISDFKQITELINTEKKELLLSPLTITLGDEFQGIPKTLEAALEIIFAYNEKMIEQGVNFKLRYVLVEGEIETEINSKIAYEMLGEGLTFAREKINELKGAPELYCIALKNKNLSKALNDSFAIYQKIINSWKLEKDYTLIHNFIKDSDYKKVALSLNKTRALMWKRERSLWIKEYLSLKNVIRFIAQTI